MDVQASSPLFCTLGMVVLDEIHLPGGRILRDVAGGSCAFSTLGARLAVEDDQAQRVACYVLAGEDFPGAVEQQLQRWGIDLVVQKRHGLQSTRAKLQYHDQSFSSKWAQHPADTYPLSNNSQNAQIDTQAKHLVT